MGTVERKLFLHRVKFEITTARTFEQSLVFHVRFDRSKVLAVVMSKTWRGSGRAFLSPLRSKQTQNKTLLIRCVCVTVHYGNEINSNLVKTSLFSSKE